MFENTEISLEFRDCFLDSSASQNSIEYLETTFDKNIGQFFILKNFFKAYRNFI